MASSWTHQGSRVSALATFSIKARVLMKTTHSLRIFDGAADISPYDFVLGWGPLSDTPHMRQLSLLHSTRTAWWSSKPSDLSWEEVVRHASNLHAIPANYGVETQLDHVSVDDLVTFSGYLVQVDKPGYLPWTSPLSRTDTGNGACEIMWINQVIRH